MSNQVQDPEESLISSLYPPPPPYVRFFTDENVRKVDLLIKQGESRESIAQKKDLRFLVPPNPPERPTYRSFGDIWNFRDKFVTLKESGVTQLYDSERFKSSSPHSNNNGDEAADGVDDDDNDEEIFTKETIEELKKMTKSLLLNFLEFIGILSKNPAYAYEKIENIRIILINLHHLLNSYRLHQSRESLILKIEEKISEDYAVVEKIKQTCENVENRIKMLIQDEVNPKMKPVHTASEEDNNDLGEDSTAADKQNIEKMKEEALNKLLAAINDK